MNELSVRSVGMVCSVGLDAPSACAAIRARVSRIEELHFHDRTGKPILGAPAREATIGLQGAARLAPMLARAIRECSGNAPVPLLLAVDDLRRPDLGEDRPARLVEEVQRLMGLKFPPPVDVFHEGRTGFFRALQRAADLSKRLDFDGCIAAAADSYLNGRALDWLLEQDRLKTEFNPDGIIPGEAAAALFLQRPKKGRASMMQIAGLGFGEENESPNLARGLADAIRAALASARVELEEVDFRVGGMTGDRRTFMEASTALARLQRVHKDEFELWVPAEKLGDVGAALPACMLVVTATAFAKGYAPGARALVTVSSDSPARAACVVTGGADGM